MAKKSSNDAATNFLNDLEEYAYDLALLFAHEPDEQARTHLQASLDRLRPQLGQELGSELAERIVAALGSEVLLRKAALECRKPSRA